MQIMRILGNIIALVLILLFAEVLNAQVDDKQKKRLLRILLFPRGSSLQLVYCLTVPTVNMPNIFVVGVTGSLAWELPYDPNEPYRKRAELLHRRIDRPTSGKRITQDARFRPSGIRDGFYRKSAFTNYPRNSTYYDQWRHGYHDKYIPVRISNPMDFKLRWLANRKRMKHLYYRRIIPGNGYNIYDDTRSDYDHPIYNEFHRRSRRDLYMKLEKLLETMRLNGKECIAKMLCYVSKVRDRGGSFMEEILKTIFRNKRSHYIGEPDPYDTAANAEVDCSKMYSQCEEY